MLLELQQLTLALAQLRLGLAGVVQIALELAAKIFGGGLLLEQLVGQIGGGQHRCVHAADPAGSHDVRHLVVHQGGDFLHIGGAFLADQRVLCAADGHGDLVCHISGAPFSLRYTAGAERRLGMCVQPDRGPEPEKYFYSFSITDSVGKAIRFSRPDRAWMKNFSRLPIDKSLFAMYNLTGGIFLSAGSSCQQI